MTASASGGLGGQVARFVVVGTAGVLVDYLVYRLLLGALDTATAKACGFVAGAAFGYITNRLFTFRVSSGWHPAELGRYLLVYAGGLTANVIVNAAVLTLLTEDPSAVSIAFLAATAVSTVMNFIGLKWLVFTDTRCAPVGSFGGPEVAGEPALSLVIPCYNEARNLPLLVARLEETFIDEDVEAILVDNGSTDDTPAVLERLLQGSRIRSVRVGQNRGYGFGIRAGLDVARGRVIGWTHADMQTDPADALRGLELARRGADPVFVKGRRYGRPLADVVFTMGMSAFESLLLGRTLRDINAQPTLFPRRFFESWRSPPDDFSLDLYAYHHALEVGLPVRRFPVRFGERAHGTSHWNVNWRAKVRFIRRTMAFSLRLRRELRASA